MHKVDPRINFCFPQTSKGRDVWMGGRRLLSVPACQKTMNFRVEERKVGKKEEMSESEMTCKPEDATRFLHQSQR